MDVEGGELKARSILLTDGCRIGFLFLASSLAVLVVCLFVAQFVQGLLIPSTVAGRDGPWIVWAGPSKMLEAAVAVSGGVNFLVLTVFKRHLLRHYCVQRTYLPGHGLHGRSGDADVARSGVWLRDGLTMLALALCFGVSIGVGFYFFHWTRVSSDGFESRGLMGSSRFTFEQVVALHHIPEGTSVDNKRADKSSYIVRFRDDASITLESGSRVLAEPEFKDLLDYIVKRTGKTWEYDPRVR